jgi:proline dehydrogenase
MASSQTTHATIGPIRIRPIRGVCGVISQSTGVVIQAYLVDAEADLDARIRCAKGHGRRITVRLVKSAYGDDETVRAMQDGWPSPVWLHKAECHP